MCRAAGGRCARAPLLHVQPRSRTDRDPRRAAGPAAPGLLTTLVIVAGAPASGKTTLAKRLAPELQLALLSSDDIKEVLYDTLGAPDRASSRRLGAAAYAVLYRIAARVLSYGDGVVAEGAFMRGLAEPDLLRLCTGRAAFLIHCEAPREIIESRLRSGRPGRHPQHHDAAALAEILAALDEGRYGPLDLGISTLRLSTADGYSPPLEAVSSFIAAQPG